MKCPAGLVVYFRTMTENNQFAYSVHPDGRSYRGVGKDGINYDNLFEILNEAGEVIGLYERDFVAAILPLATVGPSSADLQK